LRDSGWVILSYVTKRHRRLLAYHHILVHSHDVVHGDLTGVRLIISSPFFSHKPYLQSNVLIDARGRACLSDFGLSTLIAEFQGTSYFTSSIRGAVRYAAPEIYATSGPDPIPSVRVSTHSDIYSFGSVMLQVRLISMINCLELTQDTNILDTVW
jgi:serine/threonine protein kinase